MKKTVCFLFLAGVLAASPAAAVTRTWNGGFSSNWTNTLNWSDNTLPAADEIADLSEATGTIDLTADVTVGEILYNPTPVSGTTNTLTILFS